MDWYAINVMPNKGEQVKQVLEQRIALLEEKRIREVAVPDQDEYPNALFLLMHFDIEAKKLVMSIPFVIGFIGGPTPSPLKSQEVARILGRAEQVADETATRSFKAGEEVRIMYGPFSDHKAVVETVDDANKKLKAIVTIFGRKTPVELNFDQVE